jgi:hypothetical protein
VFGFDTNVLNQNQAAFVMSHRQYNNLPGAGAGTLGAGKTTVGVEKLTPGNSVIFYVFWYKTIKVMKHSLNKFGCYNRIIEMLVSEYPVRRVV